MQGCNQGTALAVKPQAANQETDGVGDTLSLLLKGTSQRVAIGSTRAARGDEAPEVGRRWAGDRQTCPSVRGPILPVPLPSPFWPVYRAQESVTEILMLPRHSNWHQLNCYIHV